MLPSLPATLSAPFALLLRRLLSAISSLSLASSASPSQPSVDNSEPAATRADSRWDWLDTLRWPIVLRLEVQSEQEGVEDAPPDTLSSRSKKPPEGHAKPPPAPLPPPHPDTELYRLLYHPLLFDPIRTPRLPIVLCHGLYGFDVRGPSSFPALQLHYWTNVLKILRGKVGAEVICPGVPGTGSIEQRALKMDQFLSEKVPGKEVNFVAHSMGGLDCRHLITHVRPVTYKPASLMTISTPHRGSAFMDWCTANIGVGTPSQPPSSPLPPPPPSLPYILKSPLLSRPPQSDSTDAKLFLTLSALPSSLTSLLLSMLDSPAYANLTTSYLAQQFNPRTPDMPGVRYFSIGARVGPLSVLHPLWLPKLIMDAAGEHEPGGLGGEGGNDGLVSVASARWGEWMGEIEECDHWEMRGAKGVVRALETWGRRNPSSPASPASQSASPAGALDNLAHASRHTLQARTREASKEAGRLEREGKVDREERTAVDRLSAIVDWMTEYVPLGSGSSSSTSASASGQGGEGRMRLGNEKEVKERERERRRERERAPAFDLERFYVAISRKLWEEGL